jgi:hypothetical protein
MPPAQRTYSEAQVERKILKALQLGAERAADAIINRGMEEDEAIVYGKAVRLSAFGLPVRPVRMPA